MDADQTSRRASLSLYGRRSGTLAREDRRADGGRHPDGHDSSQDQHPTVEAAGSFRPVAKRIAHEDVL
jgi:hypothetical protein